MKSENYRIDVDPEINKTRVLFKGSGSELFDLREMFSEFRASEVYPAFTPGFRTEILFYSTDELFLERLREYCAKELA